MTNGIKHFVQCRCILPQFKRHLHPTFHRFPVFSIIDDDDHVEPKFVACPNCGIVHKIIDLCRSEIQPGRENNSSVVTIDDLKSALPEKLVAILESNDAHISSWEEAQFIIEAKDWGRNIVLSTENIGDSVQGKFVKILGDHLFKVDTFVRDEILKGPS